MLWVIIGIAVFLLTLWLTGRIATLLGAGNSSMADVFIALLLAGIFQIPIVWLVQSPPLLLLLSLVITVTVLSIRLEIKPVGALVVYLANSAIWFVVYMVILFVGLDIGLSHLKGITAFEGDANIAAVEQQAEAVCACGFDEDCQIEEYMHLAMMYSHYLENSDNPAADARAETYQQRADACFDSPRVYQPRALTERVTQTTKIRSRGREVKDDKAQAAADASARAIEARLLEKYGSSQKTEKSTASHLPAFNVVPLSEARQYRDQRARVTRTDQQQFEGELDIAANGDLSITQRRVGGQFGLAIRPEQVLRLEILQARVETTALEDQAGQE